MMRWGIFDGGENIHVAPVGNEGHIAKPHIIDEFCCCSPKIEQGESGRLIIIHNEEN